MTKNKDSGSLRRVTLQLLLVSFTILFQELLLIRWLGQQVRILAYFPNVILISAFLGIGLGCLLHAKRDLRIVWPVSLLILMVATAAMGNIIFTQESLSEHLWLLYYDLPPGTPVIRNLFFPITGVFILSALSFVPLGQRLAKCLEECRRLRSALWGYTWDIVGSSLGVAAFTLMSFLRWSPPVWFLVLGLCALGLAARGRARFWVGLTGFLLVIGTHGLERGSIHSPYYAIRKSPSKEGMTAILTNGSLHQFAMPLRKDDSARNVYVQKAKEGYHTPYRVLAKKPRRVLVLGGGTGNDVAVALDEGAEAVDVVEIDPVILELGKTVHPNQPYQSPRVRLINADARSFLNSTDATYDLIVFGTLDSMTRLSALSNVRLDNFVYTVESFKAAKKRLAPEGVVVLYFMVGKTFLGDRLAGMLTQAFERIPWVLQQHRGVFNAIFMSGPQALLPQDRMRRAGFQQVTGDPDSLLLPHDDWPFLYLEQKGVGLFYLKISAAILALSVLAIFGVSGRLRKSLASFRPLDGIMLLFGVAFLLLETRGVMAMNLLWGATWLTNAVVFQSIFVMILLGIAMTSFRPLSFEKGLIGLLVSLFIVYLCPLESLLSVNPAVKIGLSLVLIGLPIFFASVTFSQLFARAEDPGVAFGWNLLGAVLGGLLELLSMSLGLKSLILVAMACYLGAAWIYEKNHLSRS